MLSESDALEKDLGCVVHLETRSGQEQAAQPDLPEVQGTPTAEKIDLQTAGEQ